MKILKKASKCLTLFFAVLVAIFALFLVGAKIAGFKAVPLITKDMEPTYKKGSLIMVKELEYTKVKVGEVISFVLKDESITISRVDSIADNYEYFIIKGDGNSFVDEYKVYPESFVGTYGFVVPVLGYVANFILKPPGSYITIIICIITVISVVLPYLLKDSEGKEEKVPKKKIKTQYRKI